jgi:hypothetical protein
MSVNVKNDLKKLQHVNHVETMYDSELNTYLCDFDSKSLGAHPAPRRWRQQNVEIPALAIIPMSKHFLNLLECPLQKFSSFCC